jgi:diphthine synthase
MLYFIGIGLGCAEDISIRGLKIIQQCDKIYLEQYTSRLSQDDIKDLETLYGKNIEIVNRSMVEENAKDLVKEAKHNDVALLIIGSPFSATTHSEFLLLGKREGVVVEVIDNASVLTAVGLTGLFLYKFGRVTTIPFENRAITSPYDVYKKNQTLRLHTLFLLDIKDDKMMTVEEGLQYLMKQGLDKDTLIIGCGGLGGKHQQIVVGKASDVKISSFPQCFIVPGDLHFKEKEVLTLYRM